MIQNLLEIKTRDIKGKIYDSIYGRDMRQEILEIFTEHCELKEHQREFFNEIIQVVFELDCYQFTDQDCTYFLYNLFNKIGQEDTYSWFTDEIEEGVYDFSELLEQINSYPKIPETWEDMFHTESFKSNLSIISERMLNECDDSYYPLKEEVFKCFHLCKFEDLKVVLIGQDPYPQTITINGKYVPKSMGLSFSARRGDKIPFSLNKIYRRMRDTITRTTIIDEVEYEEKWTPPQHGDLTSYAKQGILFLNTYLTVGPERGPKSHVKIWNNFVKNNIIHYIVTECSDVIFILWGNDAKKLKTELGTKNHILEGYHPAARGNQFAVIDHFNDVNVILDSIGKEQIDWFDI